MEIPVSRPQTEHVENRRRLRQQMRIGLRPGILYFGAMCVLAGSEKPAGVCTVPAAAAAASDSPQEVADQLRAEVIQLNPDPPASSTAVNVRRRQTNGPRVVIRTHADPTTPQSVLGRAELIATSIFGGIGVPVVWSSGSKHALSVEGELSIEMRLNTRLPGGSHPGALAYAVPYGTSETGIHVFIDRVLKGVPAGEAGDLLRYVMAHEITHVLQGVARHSAEGIMKAHWDEHDRREMAFRRLPFAAIDTELIRAGLGRLTAAENVAR
jgi:hypothetical protein